MVVGAGAMGMAFTDALVEHADVRVVLVDRRHGVGGHWLNAYPFVRLHQSSSTYGVASTLLGGNRIQESGPEAGLGRAGDGGGDLRVLRARPAGAAAGVRPGLLLPQLRLRRRGTVRLARVRRAVPRYEGRRRVVNAHYLSPMIPATTPPPFGVADGVRVLPVNDLVDLDEAPSQYVIAGSGKTATDACIWLLENGVDPDAIVLGPPPRPVDDQPRCGAARSGGVLQHGGRDHGGRGGGQLSGRPVPPDGGGRRDGPDRPVRDSDDGQDRHAGALGARPPCAPSSGSSGSATSCRSSPAG